MAGGGEEAEPVVLLPGVSPWVRPCPLWGGATAARMAFLLPPPTVYTCPPLVIYCTNLSYSPQPEPKLPLLGKVAHGPELGFIFYTCK